MTGAGDSPQTDPPAPSCAVVASPLMERRSRLSALLATMGMGVDPAASIGAALDLVQARSPAVAVLQGFPLGDELLGFCRALQDTATRLVVVGPSAELIDRIIVLELGADDYLCEPLDERLLTSRLKAVLRRSSVRSTQTAERPGRRWSLDVLTREAVSPAGDRVQLTPSEMSLFDLFIRNRGSVVNEELVHAALGRRGGAAFRNATSRLRRKLGVISGDSPPIRSIPGIGYVHD